MKKITLLSILGLLLYGMTLFIAIPAFPTIDQSKLALEYLTEVIEKQEIPVALAASKGTAAKVTPEDGSETDTKSTVHNTSTVSVNVLSTINLRYDNEIYLIESSDIEYMLGNSNKIGKATKNLEDLGVAGVETYIIELFENLEDEKKYYQMNRHGILKDQIRGFEYYEEEYGPDTKDAAQEVLRVLNTRLRINGGNQDYITVKSVYHPGTNGDYTDDKYLELDQSKQRMYAWENGELYKAWDASGFFDEYAVYGVFDVKNKSQNAWSPIAEKWMPYWMAFYWDPGQQAWYGLHELVYWYDADGNRIEESSDSIGQKKSGGCVRLDRGEMVNLYSWSEVGMHFLIHE